MVAGMSHTVTAFVASGDPATLVVRADVPAPTPGPTDVLLAVDAYSVNRGEVFLLDAPRSDWRPGQDVAGRVLRAAADGGGPPEGARVVAHAAQGGWATQVAVPSASVAVLPEGVSTQAAAPLGVAALTALRLVRRAGDVTGRRILLTGASGGVGHFFVELAASRGARVTAVSASPARGERLLALGAEAVVTSLQDAEGPFDVVVESVGGEILPAAIARVAPGGLVLWLGQASRQPSTLDFFAIVAAGPPAAIVPFSYWRTGASDADDLGILARLVDDGRLHPELGMVEDWAATPEVLAAVRDRKVRGNAVLRVSAPE